MLKQQKGITLIALVVTIIVLLILAGITIATLMGENGIIGNSQEAKTHNAYSQAREQMELAYMAVRTEIAMQTAKDGTYSPVTKIADLVKVVEAEIDETKGWNVQVDVNAADTIAITHTNTAIDAGVIDGSAPAEEGYVTGKIKVIDQADGKTQTATFSYDTGDSAVQLDLD